MSEQFIVTMMDNNLSNIFPSKLSANINTNSQQNDNTPQQNDNTPQQNNNTPQQNDNTSQQNDNIPQQNDNTSQQNDNTSHSTESNILNTNKTSNINFNKFDIYYGIKWLTGC